MTKKAEDTREKMLEDALKKIEQRFSSTLTYASSISAEKTDYISTGSIGLDWAMGGGVPRGNITTIYGPYSAGKSTLCLTACANAQKEGAAAYIKMENWMPPNYATALGVDLDKLILTQSTKDNRLSGEQALSIAESLMRTGAVPIVVIDSIPALYPKKVAESEIGDNNYAAIARLLSDSLKPLSDAAEYGNSALVFTSQERATIGATAYHGIQPVHMYGGKAIEFYSDVIVKLKRSMDKATKKERQTVIALVEKNRLSIPQREATFEIEYGRGIDAVGELAALAVEKEIIVKSGAWYKYGDKSLQGMDAVVEWLRGDKAIAAELKEKVLS